jgi:hypothetical protein
MKTMSPSTALAVVPKGIVTKGRKTNPSNPLCPCGCRRQITDAMRAQGRTHFPGHLARHDKKKSDLRKYYFNKAHGGDAIVPAGQSPRAKMRSHVDTTILDLRRQRDSLNEAIRALEALDQI